MNWIRVFCVNFVVFALISAFLFNAAPAFAERKPPVSEIPSSPEFEFSTDDGPSFRRAPDKPLPPSLLDRFKDLPPSTFHKLLMWREYFKGWSAKQVCESPKIRLVLKSLDYSIGILDTAFRSLNFATMPRFEANLLLVMSPEIAAHVARIVASLGGIFLLPEVAIPVGAVIAMTTITIGAIKIYCFDYKLLNDTQSNPLIKEKVDDRHS